MEILKKAVGHGKNRRFCDAVLKICLHCKSEFLVTVSALKRGEGKFCTRSCGAYYNNKNRKKISLECQLCGNPFESTRHDAKYCSPSCKRHQKAKKSKEYQQNPENHVYHLSGKIRKKYGRLPCMVKDCNCNWDTSFLETHGIVCDIHHIKKRSEGGDDSLSNLIATCPNSHRLLDRGLITTDRIINIEEYIRRNSPHILEEFFQTQV